MIIVKKATRKMPSDKWIDAALGIKDEFGNPFQIIKLRWVKNNVRKNAPLVKTRGFDDAVIQPTASGDIKISYRQKNGSLYWYRPMGDVGPIFADCAVTPNNLRKLATHYRDKIWQIVNAPAIEQKVKKMSDDIWAKMDEDTKNYNLKRIKAMHTSRIDANRTNLPDSVAVNTAKSREEYLKDRENELNKREIELANREAKLTSGVVEEDDLVENSPVEYTKEGLSNCTLPELKKMAREMGLETTNTDTKASITESILTVKSNPQEGEEGLG